MSYSLEILLKSARKYKTKESKFIISPSDVSVKFQLGKDVKESSLKKKTFTPDWNETFRMRCQDPESEILKIVLYDKKNTVLGHGNVKLNKLVRGSATKVNVPLKPQGTIKCVLTACDFGLQKEIPQRHPPHPSQHRSPHLYYQPQIPQQPPPNQGYQPQIYAPMNAPQAYYQHPANPAYYQQNPPHGYRPQPYNTPQYFPRPQGPPPVQNPSTSTQDPSTQDPSTLYSVPKKKVESQQNDQEK